MKEIVITGIGTCNSIGNNVSDFWQGLLTQKSGVHQVRRFDVNEHPNQFACEIDAIPTPLSVDDGFPLGRAARIILPTVEEALLDAGINWNVLKSLRIGLCVGTTMGEIDSLEQLLVGKDVNQPIGPNAIADQLMEILPFSGPVWTITNACAAGNLAIARAMDELQAGRADVMIAGGVDAISWVAFTGFSSLRAMSSDYCRPFDKNRKGLILGEGAGVIILETLEHLKKRCGKAKAHLLGYGLSADAHHITQPDPEAQGAVRAMKNALEMAQIDVSQIGYISAHGTGTPANDRMEATAIQSLFDSCTDKVKVSSIKGHIGHTLGAASVIEAVACVKALETGILPPTLNLTELDPECDIDVIANTPCYKQVDYILSNAYAFGGINSSILLGRKGSK